MAPRPRCFALLKVLPRLAVVTVVAGCGNGGAGAATSTGSSDTSSSTGGGTAEATSAGPETGDESTGGGAQTHPCSRELTFKTNIGGEYALVSATIDGSEAISLTGPVGVIEFSWSPDGTSFVYTARVGSATDLFIVHPAGVEPLVESAVNEWSPEWAPVGDAIAFTRSSAEAVELWTVNSVTATQTLLTRVEGAIESAFTWSPGADAIALAVQFDDHASLLRVPAAGGEAEVLVDGMLEIRGPAWAPDGATIVFAGRDDLYLQAHTVLAAGGAVQRVTEGFASHLAWSPDASTLVYRGAAPFTSDFRLYLVTPGSEDESELLPDLDCRLPRWCDAPDLIVAQCRVGGNDRVIVIDARGGSMQEIASPGINDREPRWRPEVL